MLKRKKFPTHDCPRNLANMFADYFESKVQRIRASFPIITADSMNAEQQYHGPELCEFSPTKPTELGSLVKFMTKKSCFRPWISDERLFFRPFACFCQYDQSGFTSMLMTQIYMSFNRADALQSKSVIERCIQDVQQWMVLNKL